MRSIGAEGFFVDPRCRGLVSDLRQVSWKSDANGNVLSVLDKSDPERTRLSDALGYLCWEEFGKNHEVRFVRDNPW